MAIVADTVACARTDRFALGTTLSQATICDLTLQRAGSMMKNYQERGGTSSEVFFMNAERCQAVWPMMHRSCPSTALRSVQILPVSSDANRGAIQSRASGMNEG